MLSLSRQTAAICVLGAHRSGTSAVTRALNLLGVYLGEPENLMPPQPENPKGFWEHLDIYHLQERILAACDRTWDSPAPLPEGWQRAAVMAPLADELAALVRERFASRPLWLWKDPRTCLLLPLWRKVLAELSIELRVLFVVRNPLDVARSLHRRNGYPVDKGFGIWLHYNLAAMHDLAGLEVVWLSYDRFLDDWETELRRCATGLHIPWPGDVASLRREMQIFVRPDLRHSLSSTADLLDADPPPPVLRLYEILQQCLSAGHTPAMVQEEVDRLHAEFASWARLFTADMAQWAARQLEEQAQAAAGHDDAGPPPSPTGRLLPQWVSVFRKRRDRSARSR